MKNIVIKNIFIISYCLMKILWEIHFQIPFELNEICSYSGSFPFDNEPNRIQFDSQSKGEKCHNSLRVCVPWGLLAHLAMKDYTL